MVEDAFGSTAVASGDQDHVPVAGEVAQQRFGEPVVADHVITGVLHDDSGIRQTAHQLGDVFADAAQRGGRRLWNLLGPSEQMLAFG